MVKPVRILLVDGFSVVRDALRALIATEPDMIVVGEAADRLGAEKQAQLLQLDVIILDLATLGPDGVKVVANLTKNKPQSAILILTNEIEEVEISAAIDAGVRGYLFKGTAGPEILEAIRGLHRGESTFDPSVKQKQT